ncbi:hypothetical protein OROGR_030879 [Orobanche gracilis]
METKRGEKKTNSIFKKLERYLSNNKQTKPSTETRTMTNIFTKSKSCHRKECDYKKSSSSPNGCFSVYVGPERQRFVIKTEYANHPLFKMLLEESEMEYGFVNEGPLLLPCEVDIFYKVLAEMDGGDDDRFDRYSCGSGYACGSPFMARSRSTYGCGLPIQPR